MMTILITVLLIIVVATATFWLGGKTSQSPVVDNNQTNNTQETNVVEVEDNILTPIKKAEEAKDALEERSGTSLNLSNKNLTKVPSTVFGQTDLVNLNLSTNKLEGSLPAEVRHLRNLRTLNLSHNNFTGVPAEIGQLGKLEILDLSYNKITGLPYELGNLSTLQKLDLRGNAYSKADLEVIKSKLPSETQVLVD